jgi:hypothetical protein
MKNVFEMQGRFLAIGGISGMYVMVSEKYIRPGINRMEQLAPVDESEYQYQLGNFDKWCHGSVKETDSFWKG